MEFRAARNPGQDVEDRQLRLRRTLFAACALAGAWAVSLTLTGGFALHVFSLQVSSRNPRTPLLIAVLCGVAACAVPAPGGRWRALCDECRRGRIAVASIPARWPWLRYASPAALVASAGVVMHVSLWADARPLWLDEEMIALNLRDRSVADLTGALWLGQSAPFGWLVLQRAALLALGTGELAMRLVPMLFGAGTLLVALWAGRRWMGAAGAAVLVLLCAVGRWLTHFPFEVKHYSADTLWGLLLPALAAWAIEGDDPRQRTRRAAIWWGAAAVGHWLANGALLATPACAAILFAARWWRDGTRAAVAFALLGLAWLASFGLHFFVTMRHTVASEFLRNYWVGGLPPVSAGPTGTIAWLAERFEPLALNPAGTTLWLWLWALAVCGFALSASRPYGLPARPARPWLGALLAAMPLSALVLGGFAIVPLLDRLALWIVPALYAGVALFVDGALWIGRQAYVRRAWPRLIAAVALVLLAVPLCLDIVIRGKDELERGRPLDRKQGLDDRRAIAWLMSQHRPGDAFITTHLALPALWWYGAFPLAGGDSPGSRHADGGRIFEAGYAPESDCGASAVHAVLRDETRLLVYSGFPDVPDGYEVLLLESLAALGTVQSYRRFADISRVAVIDLRAPRTTGSVPLAELHREWRPNRAPLRGCVTVRRAGRW